MDWLPQKSASPCTTSNNRALHSARRVEPAAFTKISALGDGYRVSVRIVTLAEDKAVQVPVSAAWIRIGLAPGQQVIVYPPAAVQDGVRVKARKV